MKPRLLVVAAFALGASLLGACKMMDEASTRGIGANEPSDDVGEQVALIRIDVIPSGDSQLAPQSFVLEPDSGGGWRDLRLELAPTVTWSGQVLGFQATPYATEIDVPGESFVPVEAWVEASIPGQRANAGTTSDSDGRFSLSLPAGEGYRISVVPGNGSLLPFEVIENVTLDGNLTEEYDLGHGQPVYGTVLQSDGSALPEAAEVWLEHLSTGVAGPRAPVVDGHFLLRALPGDYRLVVGGTSSGSYLPRVSRQVTVEEDAPARVDVEMGILQPVEVEGSVVGLDGFAVEDTALRFISQELDDAEGVSVVEDDARDSDGAFRVELLPGRWILEAVPPARAEGDDSPLRMSFENLEGDVDLGTLVMEGWGEGQGVVLGSNEEPLENVLVTARDIEFDGNVYTTRTGPEGGYRLKAPKVALEVSFAPPTANETVTWVDVDRPADLGDVKLPIGEEVSGTLFTPDGDPLVFSLVEVRDGQSGVLYGTVLTDAEGGFSLMIDRIGGEVGSGQDTGYSDTGTDPDSSDGDTSAR